MINSARSIREFLSEDEVFSTSSHTGRTSQDQHTNLSQEQTAPPFQITFSTGEQITVEVKGIGSEPSSFWRLMAHVQRLAAQQQGWDSFRSEPLHPLAVARAFHHLPTILQDDGPEPIVVPTRDGGLQFEWHNNGIDLEIEIPPAQPISVLIADSRADEEIEQEGFDSRAIRDALLRMRTR